MRFPHLRVTFGFVLIAALVVGAALALSYAIRYHDGDEAQGEAEYPPALGRHIDALKEALPGNQGMSDQGPSSAAEADFLERAFPADTISVAQMDAARSAFTATKGRAFPRGKGRKGTWVSVGPSQALYPDDPLRTSFLYVPSSYLAGGRVTSIALAASCVPGHCLAYVTPAGGGVWRAKNALADDPHWEYLGGPLGINAAGVVYIDPNDDSGETVYVGTGEANICASGCVAGTGLYKSTDGGDTWSAPLGGTTFNGMGIGSIVVKPGAPDTIYAGVTTALRGYSSVCCSGITRPVPGAGKWGLYKSTDGGATWAFVHDGSINVADCVGDLTEWNNGRTCSPRGVRWVVLDPLNAETVYAASYARGVWRSADGGSTWTQIKPSLNSAVFQTIASIAVTQLANGSTRMYVYEGNNGAQYSRLSRSDSVASGAPVFTDLTSTNRADPGWAWFNLCGSQCWYDEFVYTPDGHPDIVYAGGSYSYGETVANKRAVVLSTDAGVSGTDMTFDGTDSLHPNGIHPDQHAIVTVPGNPFLFIEGSDGGLVRSSGELVDRSAWCDDPNRGLGPTSLARCRQMLSNIPSELQGINKGMTTLQFQSLSVDPRNPNVLQGGTQDNGTWQTEGSPVLWHNTMVGDGGQSGFDAVIPEFRMHNFTNVSTDVNFNYGNLADWIWTGDPVCCGGEFYAPVITDPVVSKTMFAGNNLTAYRTKTAGLGSRTIAEAQVICNEWFGTFAENCGDWAELGPTRLTNAAFGTRDGGFMAAIERTIANTSIAWAATTTGRVFISGNVDAEPASAVAWTRLDDDAAIAPNRFVSSIHVDPANGNHAWVSYSGFGSNTPGAFGHVFEVSYNPGTGVSIWTDRSYNFGDLPVTDLVRDDVTGDLYAASDFGVSLLAAGTTTWVEAATGMPNVEVAGLTVVPGARILYAATHGQGAWRLNLQ